MGQRTQMYIVEHRIDKNKKKRTTISGFHNQWGSDGYQLLDALAYILQNRLKAPKKGRDYGNSVYLGEYSALAPDGHLFDALDEWGEFVGLDDNNNGIIVIEIYRDCFGRIALGSIQCFCGEEDGEEGKPITLKEMVHRQDPETLNAIKCLLRAYNITEKDESQKIAYCINSWIGGHETIYIPKNSTDNEIKEIINLIGGIYGN